MLDNFLVGHVAVVMVVVVISEYVGKIIITRRMLKRQNIANLATYSLKSQRSFFVFVESDLEKCDDMFHLCVRSLCLFLSVRAIESISCSALFCSSHIFQAICHTFLMSAEAQRATLCYF
jgi:hypothetical protein